MSRAVIRGEVLGKEWRESLMFRRLSGAVQSIPKVRGLWQRVVINSLYRMPGPDWPPVIRYEDTRWVIR